MPRSKTKRASENRRKARKREEVARNADMAKKAFTSNNLYGKDIAKTIKKLSREQIDAKTKNEYKSQNDIYKLFFSEISSSEKDEFVDFVGALSKGSGKMLEDVVLFKALILVFSKREEWIRKLSSWKRKTYNPERQFSGLIRHLFCKYEVPLFMDKAWFADRNKTVYGSKIQWFLDIGSGQNIRKSSMLPISMTKRMAHEFLEAPESYTIDQAFRWAQIKSLNGDERLCQTINGTILRELQGRRNEEFWLTVLEFFCNNPMIDPAQVGPIIDYINAMKYGGGNRVWRNGVLVDEEPADFRFSMKGRNPETLLRQTEEWHEELNQFSFRGARVAPWRGLDIPNYSITIHKGQPTEITYKITQLLTHPELHDEGKKMGHCVSSYAHSCSKGVCSIWSLRSIDAINQTKRMVTIELRRGEIVQIRGRFNRMAEKKEMQIIQKWAIKEGLNISRWC